MAEDRTGVVARLDALEAAHKGATPGPWAPATAPSEDSALDAYIALGCGDTLARVLCELAESFRVRADALRDGTRA